MIKEGQPLWPSYARRLLHRGPHYSEAAAQVHLTALYHRPQSSSAARTDRPHILAAPSFGGPKRARALCLDVIFILRASAGTLPPERKFVCVPSR